MDFPSLYVANTLSASLQSVLAANDGGTSCLQLATTNAAFVGSVAIAPTTTGTMLDFQLETEWTGGTLIDADFGSATTLTTDLVGLEFDFVSNVTMLTDKDVTAHRIRLPALTQTSANTTSIFGFNILSTGALVQNTGAGTINWRGMRLVLPAITQTTGTVSSRGLNLEGGAITSGTEDVLHITPGAYSGGTQRGIYFASDPNDGAIVSGAGLTVVAAAAINFNVPVDGDFAGIFTNTDADNGKGVKITAGDDGNVETLLVEDKDGTDLFTVKGDGTLWTGATQGLGTFTGNPANITVVNGLITGATS